MNLHNGYQTKKKSCGKAIYENDMTHFPSQIGVSKFKLPFHIPSQFDDLFFESHRGQRSQGMRPQSGLKGTTKQRSKLDSPKMVCFWYGYGSIPINTILVGWTSINPSYFDVNYRGTRFWPIPIWKEIGELFFACLGIKFWPIARWNTM